MAYRILSLDGGGAWAVLEVMALMQVHDPQAPGREVLGEYDLVAANSGGSLVLGGLLENMTLSGLYSLFLNEADRRAIFSPTPKWWFRLLHKFKGLGPKYSAQAKLPALQHIMPGQGVNTLAQAAKAVGGRSPHLLVVGFDYDLNRAVFFRSHDAGGPQWGTGAASTVKAAEAIHASTNAPVNYFDAPAQFHSQAGRYWDGGLTGCNNPVLPALVEAIQLQAKLEDLRVLSLGTGSVVLPLAQAGTNPQVYEAQRVDSGLVTDLKKLATSILDDPPDAATFIAHVLTGGGEFVKDRAVSSVVRLNPLIRPVGEPGAWALPGGMTAKQFADIKNLEMDAVEQGQVVDIVDYGGIWLKDEPVNQPIRLDGATLAAEIGYDRFSAAKAAWEAIK